MRDEGQDEDCHNDGGREHARCVFELCGALSLREQNCRHDKGQNCGGEKRDALEKIVVPRALTVKDGERLGNVKVEPVVRRKCPKAKVHTVCDQRNTKHKGAA